MNRHCFLVLALLVGLFNRAASLEAQEHEKITDAAGRWSAEKANAWYAKQPWLVGGNYMSSNAINQLEMFQADTFNPQLIDKEFGFAEKLGFNSMRVFLHDLLWQ